MNITLVRRALAALLASLQLSLAPHAVATAQESAAPARPVRIDVDASRPLGELRPIWRFFGADEPNYATMKDGRGLLKALGAMRPQQVYFRAHNLLSSGDGTPALKWGSTNVYTEDAQGRPVYDWTIVDRIFDTYLARGVRPYVEIGFMPQALSTKPEPYQHEWRPGFHYQRIITGWAYPPRDYDKWRELVRQWVAHCVERYGRAEVETWYWEVWNEPNIFYWQGTPGEFNRLHDYAIDGIRRALPTARVGGPDTAGSGGAFMDGFLDHVVRGRNEATGGTGTPTDFLAFHAKGAPEFVDGHVRLGIQAHVKTLDEGFAKIAASPLKDRPIVIGESDPDGCAACQGPQLGYRAGTMYSSYTAAVFARTHQLAARHGVNLEGALTWAFEFEDQPYFAGQRVLSTNGIALPVLNVFRMFSMMDGQRVEARSTGEVPMDVVLSSGIRADADVAALASAAPGRVAVMVWHYHDDDVAGPDAAVELALAGLGNGSAAKVTHYRIDGTHANAYTAWRGMGAPPAPTEQQYDELVRASQLAPLGPPVELQVGGGQTTIRFRLPRQGVSLLTIETAPSR